MANVAYQGGIGFSLDSIRFNGKPTSKPCSSVNVTSGTANLYNTDAALSFNANYFSASITNCQVASSTTQMPLNQPQTWQGFEEYKTVSGVTYRFMCSIIGLFIGSTTGGNHWICDSLVCIPDKKNYVILHDAYPTSDKPQGNITEFDNAPCVNFYNYSSGGTVFNGMRVVVWKAVYASDYSLCTFDAEGGTFADSVQNPYPAFVGDAIGYLPSIAEVVKKDCALGGWMTDGGVDVDASYVVPHEDFSLKAKWLDDPVLVTLDAEGGYLPQEQMYKEVFVGLPYGAISPLPTPVRTGFLFKGWYTQPSGGELITDDTIVIQPV